MVVENRNTAVISRLQQMKKYILEGEIPFRMLGADRPFFVRFFLFSLYVLRLVVTLKFLSKLLIASRNGKGELAFRGSFPSDAFSFMDCPFRA